VKTTSKSHCKLINTPANERDDDSPVLARVLELKDFQVETTTQKSNTNDKQTSLDAAMKVAEPSNSREPTDSTGAQVQQDRTKEQEELRSEGDLPAATILELDQMLDDVYEDHVHQNPGTHLDGDITDNKLWQGYCNQLIVYPSQTYPSQTYDPPPPSGAVGRRFIDSLADLMNRVRERKWNI
jgi:hypothetical protein